MTTLDQASAAISLRVALGVDRLRGALSAAWVFGLWFVRQGIGWR